MNFFKHVHIFLIVVTKHDYSFTKESHWHIVNFKAYVESIQGNLMPVNVFSGSLGKGEEMGA